MEPGAARCGRSSENDEVAVSVKKCILLRFWRHFGDGNAEPELMTRNDKGFLTLLVL
jgi:hypothetical protein